MCDRVSHLADPSLAATLLRMSPARMLNDLATTGFSFEGLVTHDLRVHADADRVPRNPMAAPPSPTPATTQSR